MHSKHWQVTFLAFCLIPTAALVGCGGATSAPLSGYNVLGAVSVSITPPAMTVGTTTTETFTAVVNNSGEQGVQWQVNGIPGGAPIIGTIDSSGNYTAPQFVPTPSTVTITAVANADSTKSGSAKATITGTFVPAQVFVSPAGTAYVQTGTALKLSGGVIGPADTAVEWQVNGIANGNSAVGTIHPGASNTAVYTAPVRLPSPATVTIKAVAHSDATRFASFNVTLSTQPPTIATVTVTPVVAVDQAQTNFTFTADVINASDNSVFWEVTGLDGAPQVGGSAVNGTIGSATPTTGLYTAPAEVPTLGSRVSVTAVSIAQPRRGSTAVLTISPPPALGVTIQLSGPNNVLTSGLATYTATVGNASVQTVTWQVNGVTGGNSTFGTITADESVPGQGDYVAPATAPKPSTVVVGVIPTANPKIEASLPVTITPPNVSVSLVCFPIACINGSEQLGVNETQQFLLQTQGLNDQSGTWYVCVKNSNPANCVLGGNATLGTIDPDQGTDLVTYTAPASVPNPPVVIIKAIPDADPARFATATVMLSLTQTSVQVSPPGPFQVQTGELGGPFTANVIGSTDQTVSWYVNNILNGDPTVGTMVPDGQNLNAEDYIAPANVPSPATVFITAVPEADPSVVSNKVQVTIIPVQNDITIEISPASPSPLLPGQSNPNYSATVENTADHIVNWTLAPKGGGVCTTGLPTPCGTINPSTTNGTATTYTAPDVQGLPDPYFVNITATADADPTKHSTVTQEITAEAGASISITPPSLTIQAGTKGSVPFMATAINIPDFNDQNVSWTMSCNSLAPTSENCGPVFGHGDGSGPGCFDYPGDGGFQVCNNTSFDFAGGLTAKYTAPKILGNSYMEVAACKTQPGQTDGFVAVTIEVTQIPNCPGQNGSCQATMCIDIPPPAPKK